MECTQFTLTGSSRGRLLLALSPSSLSPFLAYLQAYAKGGGERTHTHRTASLFIHTGFHVIQVCSLSALYSVHTLHRPESSLSDKDLNSGRYKDTHMGEGGIIFTIEFKLKNKTKKD